MPNNDPRLTGLFNVVIVFYKKKKEVNHQRKLEHRNGKTERKDKKIVGILEKITLRNSNQLKVFAYNKICGY